MSVPRVLLNAFFFYLFPVGSRGTLDVYQAPHALDALVGDSVTITCSWKQGKGHRVSVVWKRANLSVPEQTVVVQQSLQENKLGWSNLCFTSVALKDAGKYYCTVTVEIPTFEREQGSGTMLTVKTDEKYAQAEESGGSVEELLLFTLRCLPFLTLLTAVYCRCRIEAKAAEIRIREGSGKEKENEAQNESATSLLTAAAPEEAEVVLGGIGVSCSTPSSDIPNPD